MREFKNEVNAAAQSKKSESFVNISDGCREFWGRLNDIGASNIKTQTPEMVPDIDATVELDTEQLAALRDELATLLK